jgi:hypothetical protein
MGLLAGTFAVIMIAISCDQALIALSGHRLMAVGWAGALAVFIGVTVGSSSLDDVFLRVELGLLAAAMTAMVWMAVWLGIRLAGDPVGVPVSLAEAAAEAPMQD